MVSWFKRIDNYISFFRIEKMVLVEIMNTLETNGSANRYYGHYFIYNLWLLVITLMKLVFFSLIV